jgi:hypothetical protein
MRKIIFSVLIAIILMVAISNLNTYTMKGTITDRNEITDEAGHIWEYDTEGFHKGDTVTIIFHDRGTTSRKNDIIKGVE